MNIAILSYAATLLVIIVIDYIWLGLVAKPIYAAEMGDSLRKDPNFVAAGAFYLLYAAGLTLFAVLPGVTADSALKAFGLGAALGLVAYGTYDLTNLSVMNGYSWRIALIDIAWGLVSSAVASGVVVVLVRTAFK